MSYDKAVFDRAEAELTRRRIHAEALADGRRTEIEEKLPEIAEINQQLANTSIELSNLILKRRGDFEGNFEKLRQSNLQGQEMIKALLQQNGYSADYLETHYHCSLCNDRGYSNGIRCGCFTHLLEKNAVERLNNGSQMKLCDFDSFNLSFYPKTDAGGMNCYQKMQEVYSYCHEYARTFTPKSRSIFMLGLTGLGKTHLSLAIAREAIERGYNVAYDSVINYLRAIEKEHFGRADTDTFQLLMNTDLLIMDDLGSEYESSFYTSTLYNIINTRLNKGLPTIINSNLTPSELQKRYDDRIISRLLSMYDPLRFVGTDIRQILHKRRMNAEMQSV